MKDEGGKARSRCLRGAAGLALLLASSLAFAGTGVSFLEIPVGARESALGGAGVALVSGPSSAAHNPAAMAFAPRGVSLVHNRHFADTRTLFIGFNARRGLKKMSQPAYIL